MKRFRWTRKTFRQARRLARLFDRRATLDDTAEPPLLRRYAELVAAHPQDDDPLAGDHWQRMWYIRRKHEDNDGIPF